MLTKVRKRDGRIVDFDKTKITDAIFKAAQAVGGKDRKEAERLTEIVVEKLSKKYDEINIPGIEDIQEVVEKVLIEEGHAATAKAYIIYRKKHAELREFAAMMHDFDIIDSYLHQIDWRVKENANMTYSLQGLNFHISSTIVANYWLNKVYPENIAKAHKEGDFHIHDLGTLAAYCVGWDLQDLIITGFTGVPGKISSRPAKHLRALLGQVVNFFYTLQGEAAGAQAFSNFDTLIAPFIYYDKLEYKEVKQIMQEFIYNVNVPTRVGFQTPFTNITLDLEPPSYLKNVGVVIGGKIMDKTYGEFQEEMDMINRAFAEVMMEGDANGRPFTFPIPTYNITKDFPWDDERLDALWEMTGKYGIPYFANFVNSDMKPEDARSMCCRLRLDTRELKKKGGGLFGANPLTGSIGVVTINLPRIGFLSKDETEFFEKLEQLMILAKDSLIIKRKIIERYTEQGLYPYSRFYLRSIKQAYGQYWKNHFSTIGLVGMNEACLNLLGESIISKQGHEFAIRVLEFMRERISEFQEETGQLFNLEATPAEGTSYRLARIDKKKYPEIIVANEEQVKKGAKPYYTNSSLPPVDWNADLFEILDHQDPLQTKYTGGTVYHAFIGERLSKEAAKTIVRKVFSRYQLPYLSITPTFSICPIHGYLPGEHEYCPICDAEMGVKDVAKVEVTLK